MGCKGLAERRGRALLYNVRLRAQAHEKDHNIPSCYSIITLISTNCNSILKEKVKKAKIFSFNLDMNEKNGYNKGNKTYGDYLWT